MRRYGRPEQIVTDRLRSDGAALRELGAGAQQYSARHENNRVENSHLPFRRRERAILRFRWMKTLQFFAAVHSSVSNTSTKIAASPDVSTSRPTEPPLSPSGGSSAPPESRPGRQHRAEFAFV